MHPVKHVRECRFWGLMFAFLAMTGCALPRPEVTEPEKAVLDTIPANLPLRKPGTATLLISPPETETTYDTVQMAYADSPHQIGYFGRHEWAEAPGQMLYTLLIQTIERSHYYQAVLTPPYSGRYTYRLRTKILELTQDFTLTPAVLRLSVHIQVEAVATDRILISKEIQVKEPMAEKTPQAGVVAANRAVEKALHDIVIVLFQHAP